MSYTVIAYPYIADYVPRSWRQLLLGDPRVCVVLTAPGDVLLCSPKTLPKLLAFLDARKLPYEILPRRLQVVPGGKS